MRFNMGCGARKLPGFVNVDSVDACGPDQVADLEQFPWPWSDDCAEEVQFIHSLEHMGGDPKVFLGLMRELYRICAPEARVMVKVPHPRHDNFISDPTHVRPITADTFRLFDRKIAEGAIKAGGSNSPLAIYLGVDFELVEEGITLDEPYWGLYRAGKMGDADVRRLLKERNNVARELSFVLKVRKAR